MRTRLWKVLLAATVLGLFGFMFFWWWTAPKHNISATSWRRITEGMTENQLIEVLGVPAGDYTTVLDSGPEIAQGFILEVLPANKKALVPFQYPKQEGVKQTACRYALDYKDRELTYQEWLADDCSIFVFLENGKVFMHGMGGRVHEDTMFQRIRGVLGL